MDEEQYLESKLKTLLRNDGIKLWEPPYTNENSEVGPEVKVLAQKYASDLKHDVVKIERALEELRCTTVQLGKANKTYRKDEVATLQIFLPKTQSHKKKNPLETKLNISGEQLRAKIAEKFGEFPMKFIVGGKSINMKETLEKQGVKHNSKVLVLEIKLSEQEARAIEAEEIKKNEMIAKTEKGMKILVHRDESMDPNSTPYLEIADQKGKPIKIPPKEKQVVLLMKYLHESCWVFFLNKVFNVYLVLALEVEKFFSDCGDELLHTVDNYGVLQLDIGWCYLKLEQLNCLEDLEKRLQTAQKCFSDCYGKENERLVQIKGSCGRESVLFLRLYLLQGIVCYHKGDEKTASNYFTKARDLHQNLNVDPDKMQLLLDMGFSETESRLGLRACQGDINLASNHISNRREEKAQLKKEEKEKREKRLGAINTLRGMGYSERSAARALHKAKGDLDEAFLILIENPEYLQLRDDNPGPSNGVSQENISCLQYLGFEASNAEAALRQFGGNLQAASQMLSHYGGTLPSVPGPSSPGASPVEDSFSNQEDPATTSGQTEQMEVDTVEEILKDIPEHEEDYLDLNLLEEGEIIEKYSSLLKSASQTSSND
uniref:Negative regulator of ubiquitin like proteins 1 n=1 Tax=Latimeria chalumnae TaxID=7897 RepID=H3ALE3_LATCH